jgi:hypothetical protein
MIENIYLMNHVDVEMSYTRATAMVKRGIRSTGGILLGRNRPPTLFVSELCRNCDSRLQDESYIQRSLGD